MVSSEEQSAPESSASAHPPLYRALKSRRADYVRPQTIRIKVGTWNVAARSGTDRDVREWFVKGKGVVRQLCGHKVSDDQRTSTDNKGGKEQEEDEESGDEKTVPFPRGDKDNNPEGIGLYVLGLQEIVDINSPTETLKPYHDSAPVNKWKKAVQDALPTGYQLVAESQLVGLLLLIYASPSVAGNISSVSNSNVATGLLGYVGNKGAVSARLVLGQTTPLVFVNCHLAAGSDKGSLDRRNWDAGQILSRTKFNPVDIQHELVDDSIETIGKEDVAFWFGDLNYRLDHIPANDVRNVLHRHTLNSYDGTDKSQGQSKAQSDSPSQSTPEGDGKADSSNQDGEETLDIPPCLSDEEVDPHTDPSSLQTTISSLIPHDQLRIQQKQGKAFQNGWREGPITFLPTYKYDVGRVAVFDTSEKLRGPSWCDRILYRTRQDRLSYEQQEKEAQEAKRKDEEMKKSGLAQAVSDDTVLFDYDPATDGANEDEYEPSEAQSTGNLSAEAQKISNDPVRLEYYQSCQAILTSDHKPLQAVFTLTYESVIPELKAKVHQEVAWELDRAENESRPGLTVVVDDPEVMRDTSRGEDGDANAIDFGCVAYNIPVSRSLTVANTGSVPATFYFAEIPGFAKDTLRAVPPWLNIQVEKKVDHEGDGKQKPHTGEHSLLPGELATIQIIVHVRDMNHVRVLNYGEVKLEEILVLRVKDGRDHFISVHGKWLPTCFGLSVDDLTHMPEEGARTLEATPEAWARQRERASARLSAPRELFRLTETISELTERAVAEWSMTKSGSDEESSPPWLSEPYGMKWPFTKETWTLQDQEKRAPLLAIAHEALDTNKPLNSIFPPEVPALQYVEILSEVLLAFLHSLSDGIVTTAVWQKLEQDMIAREKAKMPPRTWEEVQTWVLENLSYSPAHSVSFTFVTFMLGHIVNEVAPMRQQEPPGKPPSDPQQDGPSPPSPAKEGQQQRMNPPPPPTPASTAAFIAAGSFRRRARTVTSSSSSSETPSSGDNPSLVRRQAVETALATVFSSYLISSDVPVPSKDKEKRALEARKRGIIEPFLKTFGVD